MQTERMVLYPYAAWDNETKELLASVTVVGPESGNGVLLTIALDASELFDRPVYFTVPGGENYG